MTVRTHRSASTRRSGRPRWLAPLAVAAVIAAVLVLAGVVALSTVFYAGLSGGMILMHVGGHGHGGRGGGHETHVAHVSDAIAPDVRRAPPADRSGVDATDAPPGIHSS